MEAGDKCLLCPEHIPLMREVTEIHTIQKTVVENQKIIFEKLVDIRAAVMEAKFIAIKDVAGITSDIANLKVRIQPKHWLIGLSGVTGIAELVHWAHKLWESKP